MSGPRADDPGREASFYEEALVREVLQAAEREQVDDLGDVIGDLRRRLRERLFERPADVRLLLRSADALSRAAAAEHRLRPRDEMAFSDAVERVLFGKGSLILPPDDAVAPG